MKDILGAKKTVPLVIAIFILSFITLFLIVEFRFLNQTIQEYEAGIQKIAVNKTDGFIDELKLFTENWAQKIELQKNTTAIKNIADSDNKIRNAYLLDSRGYVIKALNGKENYRFTNKDLVKQTQQSNKSYISTGSTANTTGYLLVSAPLSIEEKEVSLIIEFSINQFKQEIFQEFLQPNYKVALFDKEGRASVWPFDSNELGRLNPKNVKKFTSGDIKYTIKKTAIAGTSLQLFFFAKDNNFDTYRIVTIMFLLFALYFCIYQFLVEFWQANSAKSYFDNIDFDILNHLKEGIMITNKFNRIIFANKAAHDFFPEKEITFKKTNLKEILGHIGASNKKFTLKKSDKSLEIIRSPIFKNGKILGSLAVISESVAKERLCALMFSKLIEILEDGVIFVTQENKIDTANMMAQYYLGKVEKGMNINDINSELAASIHEHNGASVRRITLPAINLVCEIIPVYNESGMQAGTLVFLKNPSKFE